MILDAPYGETKVHVIEVEHKASTGEMAQQINDVIRVLEEGNRLVQGSVSVGEGRLIETDYMAHTKTLWLFITTRPGPIHPADSFSAGGYTATLDRHKLGQPAGGNQ
jgi:hypothetical protein